jgi:hypothetical protein
MEKIVDYQALYSLQDEILSLVMALDNDFYLTGGTALHRFYCHHRYSVDLDFFVSNSSLFYETVNEILESLRKMRFEIEQEVVFRDFYRIRINQLLQVDFVNDRVYRFGKSNIISTYRIDNPINILANKITALISRDEEKDFFDLFCCAFSLQFHWHTILEIANKKARVEKDILIYRLASFPLPWLDKIKIISPLEITSDSIKSLCDDILFERDNSLFSGEAL